MWKKFQVYINQDAKLWVTENPVQIVLTRRKLFLNMSQAWLDQVSDLSPSLYLLSFFSFYCFVFRNVLSMWWDTCSQIYLYPPLSANPPTAFSIRLKSPESYFHWPSEDSVPICDPISSVNGMPWLVMPGSHAQCWSQEVWLARMAGVRVGEGVFPKRQWGLFHVKKEEWNTWWGKSYKNKDTFTTRLQFL